MRHLLAVAVLAAVAFPAVAAPIPCAQRRSCGECAAQLDCQWCPATARCLRLTDKSCPHAINLSSACDSCASYTSCTTCASKSGCAWCARVNRCMRDDDATLSVCPAGALASTGNDCPVVDCSRFVNCLSCVDSAHCGWCLDTQRCVYRGETSGCAGRHANFASECGGGTSAFTFTWAGAVYCTPGSPDSGAVCQCPPRSTWVGNAGISGFGTTGVRWGHCECNAGTRWDATALLCAPTNPCPPGLRLVTAGGQSRCECAQGVYDRAQGKCVTDPCTGGSRFDVAARTCQCPSGTVWFARDRRCVSSSCAGGLVFRLGPDGPRCECPVSHPIWNQQRNACEPCPAGTTWGGRACVSPNSCVNRCCAGQNDNCRPPGMNCYCDAACLKFGDCCADYRQVCR